MTRAAEKKRIVKAECPRCEQRWDKVQRPREARETDLAYAALGRAAMRYLDDGHIEHWFCGASDCDLRPMGEDSEPRFAHLLRAAAKCQKAIEKAKKR